MRDNENEISCGFGYIRFETFPGAIRALDLNDEEVDGNKIKVYFS